MSIDELSLLGRNWSGRTNAQCDWAFRQQPLGFLVGAIALNKSEFRLHIWPKISDFAQEPRWPIHNHRFSFRSMILEGQVRNQFYEVVEADGPYKVFATEYREERSVLVPQNRYVSATLADERALGVGDGSSVSAGTFHETLLGNCDRAITLLKVQSSVDQPPLVLGDQDHEAEVCFVRRRTDPATTGSLLDAAIAALARLHNDG